MAVNWTKEQKQVIESRDRNLLVSAAAGSGKTAVLVERIIRMITEGPEPLDIDRLLVMTFTKAAAAEMRERIQTAIEKKLEEHPQDAHLQQQAVMVQYAQITTIDSFCLHVMREHFDRLEIDPAFRVGDEGELLLLRSDVMEELLEDYYDNGGDVFERFVDTYAIGKADAGIGDYITQVCTFAQSNPWPKQWLEKCRLELQNVTIEEFDRTEWMQFLLADIRMQAEEWEVQLSQAVELCREEDGPEPYLPMLCEDLDHVRRLKDCGSYEAFAAVASGIVFSKLAAIRGKNSPVNPDKKEQAAECRKRIKKAVEKMKEQYLFESVEEMLADLEASREAILVLLDLAEEFTRRFQEKKRQKNLVDFNDLEHFALEILLEEEEGTGGRTESASEIGAENGPEIGAEAGVEMVPEAGRKTGEVKRRPSAAADEISAQYDEILVDEYQDSNLVQETLIGSISRERFGHPNVFMVGDVKQSIYKFRLARPELFLEKYHTYSTEDSLYQKIELHQNFRSRDLVLTGINEVFYRIMTGRLGGIEYTEETALHPGAQFEEREHLEELQTELLLLNTSGSELSSLDEDISDYTSRELEAAMIAAKIREMTDEEHGITVWDKDAGQYRRACYRDIVILLRSVSGWAESFSEVLSHQGIPAFAESRTGYFDTMEVETMLNLLAVIDNPIQDIPLAAVLKAPFCGVTNRELAHLMALYKNRADKGRDRGLYGAAVSLLAQAELVEAEAEAKTEPAGPEGSSPCREQTVPLSSADQRLAAKLNHAFTLFDDLRRESVYLPLHELLYHMYDRTGYYDYVSAMPAGETRKANLDMLVEKASAYEATSYRGVFHFIKYIEKLKKFNTDFGEASTVNEQGNTVRILSIHKSKGLEFPIVFVSGMGKLFNKQDTRGKILIDSEFGIGTDYLDAGKRLKGPTLKKNVLKRRMDLEALGEELRVLYVAMTRAKEKLIMTASDRNLEARLEKWRGVGTEGEKLPYTILTSAGSYLDWILMSLAAGNREIAVKEVKAEELLGHEIEEQIQKKLSKEELLNFDTEREYDEELGRKLQDSFQFVYPYAADVTLNTKMSVSELKREQQEMRLEDEESVFLPTLPAFLEEEETEERGVTRGTAYHRAMELLAFESMTTRAAVKKALDQLSESGRMTAEARNMVREADLERFFLSDLGKRAVRAAKAGKLFREKQFVIGIPAREMGGYDSDELVLVQGIIDAYFEEDGELVLLDYKTDYVKTEEELVRRYKAQLDYYERALSQLTGQPVKEKYIYSYRLGEIRL